jgi:uncharacterized UBP type Zn finger protein
VTCQHIEQIQGSSVVVAPSAEGCEDCLKMNSRWLHLRLCLTCGYVGCCDSSPNKHASKHYHATDHPVVKSFEPGEEWLWCYADKALFEPL